MHCIKQLPAEYSCLARTSLWWFQAVPKASGRWQHTPEVVCTCPLGRKHEKVKWDTYVPRAMKGLIQIVISNILHRTTQCRSRRGRCLANAFTKTRSNFFNSQFICICNNTFSKWWEGLRMSCRRVLNSTPLLIGGSETVWDSGETKLTNKNYN
jgi:hypothetical protein